MALKTLGIIFYQGIGGWRFDWVSFLLGMGLSLLLGVAVYVWVGPILIHWGERLWGRGQKMATWVRSNVEERYQSELSKWLQTHHLGLGQANLNDIFVLPHLLAPPEEIDPARPANFNPRQVYYIWASLAGKVGVMTPPMVSVRELLWQGRRVLVTGEDGAGKSMLLAYCADLCAKGRGEYQFLGSFMPAFIHTTDLPLQNNTPDVVEDLIHAMNAQISSVIKSGMSELVRKKLEAGLFILFLDGWDEMPASQRPTVNSWLKHLLTQYPECRVIMAAPEQGFGDLLALNFVQSGLLPWRKGHAEALGEKWAKVNSETPRSVAQYWQPGLVTWEIGSKMAVAMKNEAGEMPARPIETLESALLLRLPNESKSTLWLAPVLRELWQAMAITVLTEQTGGITSEAFQLLVDKAISQHDVQDRGANRRLQKETEASDLFVTWGDGGYRFLSPIWRDFLAASRLWQLRRQQTITDHLHDADWAGVIRFYVARAGAGIFADQFLQAEQDTPLFDNLIRLAIWASEAVDEGEWRRQLLLRLGRLIMNTAAPTILRQRAILAMAQTNESGVLTFLRQLIQVDKPFLRRTAVAALPGIESEAIIDILIHALDSGHSAVRQNAIHGLTWLNDPVAERSVLSALYHDDDLVRQIATEGLALMGGDGIKHLREATDDIDPRVRRAAIFGLVLLDEEWVLPLLKTMENDEQWAVQSVAEAGREMLSGTDEASVWHPISLSDQEWLINWAAEQRRGVPVGDGALEVLVEALAGEQPEEVRIMATVMLGQVGRRESVPALKQALQDESEMVKQAAFLSLSQLSRAYGKWLG